MVDRYKSVFAEDGNPYVTDEMRAGVARRSQAPAEGPIDLVDPYKGNWGAETTRSQIQRTMGYAPALEGLGRQLLGDQEGAQSAYERFGENEQKAAEMGPAVQSFEQAKEAGGGVGDYASALGYQAAAFVPDVALAVTGGGIGAKVGAGVARRAALRSIADAVEHRAVNQAAKETAVKVATRRAALEAPDGAASVSNAMRVANAQVNEASRKAAVEEAVKIAGRTPRIQSRIAMAGKVGSTTGGAAGFYPATVSGSVEELKNTDAEGAAKIAGVDAAASVIGSLPFANAFKAFAPEVKKLAGEAVARDAQRFLPRLAKETAQHAVGGGAAGAAMTATQLAGHKWVNDNINLLDDSSIEKYISSAVGGAILGGGIHAAGMTVGHARGSAGEGLSTFRTKAREALSDYAEKARKLRRSNFKPGDEIPMDAEGPSGLNDLFRRANDAVRGFAKGEAVQRATAAVKGAADRFRSHADILAHDESLDGAADSLVKGFEAGQGELIPGRQRAANQNPIPLEGLRGHLMSYVNADSPVWMDKSTATYVATSLERLATGKRLTPKDLKVHEALVDSGALKPESLDGMKLVGKQWSHLLDQVKDHESTAPEFDGAGDAQGTMAEQLRAAFDEAGHKPAEHGVDAVDAVETKAGEGDIVNDTMTEAGGDALKNDASPGERLANAREAVRVANERALAAKDPEAKASFEAEREAANKEFMHAQQELKDRLHGETTPTNRFGKNVFYQSSNKPEAAAKFEAAVAEPGRVEIEPVDVGRTKPIMARAALSVDSLALQELGQNSEKYQNFKTEPEKFKAALLTVMGDIKQAGIKIKPSSITAGEIKGKDGRHLTTITDADVALLRKQVRTDRQFETRSQVEVPTRKPTEAEQQEMAREGQQREQLQGEQELEDQNLHKLAPREAPTGSKSKEGDFVPNEGVRDVSLTSWAGDTAMHARAEAARGTTGANGEDPRFLAGVEIGKKLLAQELEVSGNQRRYANDLARLQDPASGKAKQLYFKALKGEFDSAKVSEKKADHEQIDVAAAREERETGGKVVPRKPETPELAKDLADAEAAQKAEKGILAPEEAGIESATRESGPHDHKAELKMLNAILGHLGIKPLEGVRPLTEKRAKQYGGLYVTDTHIEINDNLHGAERVEVLLHETGHHIIYAKLAEAFHTDPKEMGALKGDALAMLLKKADPVLAEAVLKDYEAWRGQHGPNARVVDVRTSRAPFHRGMGLREAMNGTRMSDVTEASREKQLDFHEWLADNIARALASHKTSQSVIGKFFKGIADALREAYAMITGDPALAKYAPAKSVEAWVQSMFDANTRAVREATGVSVPKASAEAIVEAAVVDSFGPKEAFDPTDEAAFLEFIRTTLPVESRQILDRVLSRPATLNVLRKLYPDLTSRLDDAEAGLENKIFLGYLAFKGGKLNLGPQGKSVMVGLGDDLAAVLGAAGEGDLAHRIFSDIANGSIERMRKANKAYDVRALEARSRGTLQHALNWVNRHGKVAEAMSKFWDSSHARARDSGIPAFRALAAKIQRPQGTAGGDEGMTPAIVHTLARYEKQTRQALDGLTFRDQVSVMDALQRQLTPEHPSWGKKPAKVQAAVEKVRALMDDSYAYMRKAGVKVGARENFFPVVIDLRNDAAIAGLTKLYSQPKFEAAIRDALGHKDNSEEGGGAWVPSNKPFPDLVKNLVEGAIDEHGFSATTGSDAPKFRGMQRRLSQFVYELGNEADIKAFAKLQSKDAAEVFARYLGPMVKRAEYTRRFGAEGEGKKALLEQMKKQGATDAQLAEADNMLKAALGTYGAEGSPVLKSISPALSEKLAGHKTRSVVAGAQAYQNARLLGLSLLSSIVDPMGIAMRTGGDFPTAWHGFKEGMHALFNKADRAELHRMLEDLGAADDTLFVLQQGFGGEGSSGLSKKVNEWVFRYNGMQGWVLNTRYQALSAGHAFLLKHADGKATEHSQRYLEELGLQPGDIHTEVQVRPDGKQVNRVALLSEGERAKATPAEQARDERVRNALRTFVDQAILRPNSMQRPLWHNDPYMGLITQYKAFGYALYDQIMTRFWREMQHGNMKVLGAAFAYMPVVIASEMLRAFLQYGPEGNPQHKDWGPQEYLALGAKRSGLMGPKFGMASDVRGDLERKNLPGSSQLGPTLGQANNAVDAFEGRRDLGKEVESALPGSAVYRHWNDDSVAEPEGAGA